MILCVDVQMHTVSDSPNVQHKIVFSELFSGKIIKIDLIGSISYTLMMSERQYLKSCITVFEDYLTFSVLGISLNDVDSQICAVKDSVI